MNLSLQQISSIATGYNQGRLDYSPSEASFYANIALGIVAAQEQYRSLESVYQFSLTSGVSSVALPSDFYAEVSLSLSSGTVDPFIRQVLPTSAQVIDSYGTAVGIPQGYALYGSQLLLGPPSDSTYSGVMRYTTVVPPLVGLMDEPVLRSDYHYALAIKTAELLAAARNDSEQEALNHQRYLDYMGSLPNDRALRQRDKLMGVTVPKWMTRTTA